MQPRFLALLLVLCALLTTPAVADTVHLTNGGKLEGKARQDGDQVIVETAHGQMTLRADEVRIIVPGKTRHDVYAEKVEALDRKDADAHMALGDWCKSKKLVTQARKHWKAAIALDTDHLAARGRLGFIRYQRKWLTETQYREARGFIKVGGEWVQQDRHRRQQAQKKRDLAAKAHVKKINDCVRGMSSMKRKTRHDAKLELQKYAESRGDLALAARASEIAGYYNTQWREVRRALVKTEVRATSTKLKRPIPEIRTSLGASSTPVRIQLPELSVVQVKTTVLIPAEIELDED